MKLAKYILVGLALIGSASATTISVGGGTSSALFVTSTGVTLTAATTTIKIGTWDGLTSTFSQFASTDATPMVIGTGTFAGKLTGNFSDNSTAATTFNNALIWYQIAVNLGGGVTGVGYFSGAATGVNFAAVSTKFPANGSGVGDSLAAETRNLTVLGDGSTAGSRVYSSAAAGAFAANTIVVGVIPEPSAALLGAIGALGLLRRRRI